LRPWELGRLTLSEITLYLEDGSPKPDQGKPVTHADAAAWVQWWRGLSPLEKLEHARRESG
jgi:hypothetical protein